MRRRATQPMSRLSASLFAGLLLDAVNGASLECLAAE